MHTPTCCHWNARHGMIWRESTDCVQVLGARGITTAEAVAQQVNGVTQYGTRRTVTLIPGDGTGPELAKAVRTVFTYVHARIVLCQACTSLQRFHLSPSVCLNI